MDAKSHTFTVFRSQNGQPIFLLISTLKYLAQYMNLGITVLLKKFKNMVVDLKANEVVTKAGDVQFFAPESEVKGKLILTNQRIYFKTTDETNKDYNMEILPQEISELLYFKTKMFFQNGLNLVTRNGLQFRFVVLRRVAQGGAPFFL